MQRNDGPVFYPAQEGAPNDPPLAGIPGLSSRLANLGGSLTGDVAWIGLGGAVDTGCAFDGPYGEPVAGKIALIRRGVCPFEEKILRAQSEGAIGVIIWSTVDGLFNMIGVTPGNGVTIPSTLMRNTEGIDLALSREAGEMVNVTLVPCPLGACCTDGPGTASDCVGLEQAECESQGGLFVGQGTSCVTPLECTALLVTFESVSATATPDGVLIEWTTTMELDNAGFRILREVPGRAKAIEVVAPFIAAAGNNIEGASYVVLDDSPRAARARQYYIEDIDVFGKVTRHGPFPVQRPIREGDDGVRQRAATGSLSERTDRP